MKAKHPTGLVTRRTADRISAAVFLAVLAAFLIILIPGAKKPSMASTTTTTTLQVTKGLKGASQSTKTTQNVTTSAAPSIWVSLLGSDQTEFLACGVSLLAAYFLAAMSQRILLGRYAISLGPLSVPEITEEQVENAVNAVLAAATSDGSASQAEGPIPSQPAGEPEPIWATISDPNLALAGWRIDLEKELRRIAFPLDLPLRVQRSARQLLYALDSNGIISHSVSNTLQDLLTIANDGAHGAKVDDGVIDILKSEGIRLLQYLRSIKVDVNSSTD